MTKAEHFEEQTADSYRKLFYSYHYLPMLACIVFFANACLVLFQIENSWLAAVIAAPTTAGRSCIVDGSRTKAGPLDIVLNAAMRYRTKNASSRAWILRKDVLLATTQFFESC